MRGSWRKLGEASLTHGKGKLGESILVCPASSEASAKSLESPGAILGFLVCSIVGGEQPIRSMTLVKIWWWIQSAAVDTCGQLSSLELEVCRCILMAATLDE